MKKLLILVLAFLVLSANFVFADLSGSYFIMTKDPVAVSQIKANSKSASGSNLGLLYLFAFGDASVDTLAKEAGIKTVKYIDKSTFSILGLFTQDTITVYGD